MLTPEPIIVCVDCGGRCHLLTHPPEDGIWEPGDIVAYRCEDCRDEAACAIRRAMLLVRDKTATILDGTSLADATAEDLLVA